MTDQLRELVARAKKYLNEGGADLLVEVGKGRASQLIRDLAALKLDDEPVAWRAPNELSRSGWNLYDGMAYVSPHWEPLYTHPAPPADDEPVAWLGPDNKDLVLASNVDPDFAGLCGATPLYTRPAPPKENSK